MDSMIAGRDQILAMIDAHADELRELGAKSLALFGSMAGGEGSSSSDVEVLADAVKPRLRSAILGEAVRASRL